MITQAIMNAYSEDLDSHEGLSGYIMNGWEKICDILQEDFTPYLAFSVPVILRMAMKEVHMSVSTNP